MDKNQIILELDGIITRLTELRRALEDGTDGLQSRGEALIIREAGEELSPYELERRNYKELEAILGQ